MKLRHLLFFMLFSVFATAQTVVDIIVNSEDHNTLEAAVIAAGLDGTLSGDGPFTVFAPTDDAFAALPAGTVDALLADPQGALTDILLYHAVAATALSTDLSDGQMVTTINGNDVTVTINMDGVFINDAQVTVADVVATNGVVHVINAVLLPPAQVDLPINFDDENVNYALGDFGNNFSSIVEDPTDAENMVVQSTKPDNAELWAGTTAGVDGLASPIPFTEDETKMTVRVWSPTAGTPVLLKVEDAADPTISVETLTNTSVAMQWETIEFDFSNEAPGTAAINLDNTYDKVSIFFNFGTDGATAGEQTYFWDDVEFGPRVSVVDVVVNSPDHTTLEAAVIAADLAGTLSGNGPFTLFAPTDDAFAALPEGTVEALLEDPQGALTDILLYHAVAGKALSTDLSDGQTITTINGKDVTVTINMDGVFINDAQVTVADIETDNGVVHVIDAVLLPPSNTVVDIVVNSEDHNTLEAAVIAADLAGTLSGAGPFTLFAPTDDAFAALGQETIDALLADPSGALTDILLYHAVAGTALSTDLSDGQTITTINGKDVTVTINTDGVFINEAQVTVADLVADNGVVHVINAVLLPPPPSVFDIIKDSPDHTILEAAIIAAGLDGTLSGGGPFTIFAPNDAAFNELGQETIDALLADPSGALTTILQYHVSSGAIGSGDLSDRLIGTAINGFDYLINVNGNGAFVNDNQITVTDLEGTNGLVHVIDGILIPSTTASVIANSTDFSVLANALIGTGLINALNDLETKTTLFAPTNGAFVNLPTDILDALAADPEGKLTNALLYHVTAGRTFGDELSDGQMLTTLLGETADITINADGVFINNAQIVFTDFFTGNGLIHIIDAVLLPAPSTVMDVIIQSDAHNTLQAAIEAAELSETLQGEGTFTVFAPTDDAFAALPAGTVEALLEDPQGDLTDILLYHVLGSVVLSTDLSDGASATTLNGADVGVSIVDGKVFINDSEVVVADIQTDNGVVHVIDMVLLPPVSTNEIAPTEASVYPNPANDKITIEFVEEIFDNPTLTMVNADGQLVKSIPNFRSNSTLNIDDLQNGIYALIITDGTNVLTKRITKIQ
ncbi:MAG: fasciclin domain-containing protein [Saprospiraceae bacterium]|nr:fasciclin domain-containing protein [Saprospiraceae bacterium]